jgi:hypothetical protein
LSRKTCRSDSAQANQLRAYLDPPNRDADRNHGQRFLALGFPVLIEAYNPCTADWRDGPEVRIWQLFERGHPGAVTRVIDAQRTEERSGSSD